MKDRIRNRLNDPFIFAVLLNAMAVLISVTLFKPFFEENDDAFISMIAEGAYGTREVHLIYTNIILGSIYNSLYAAFPGVRWHSVLQYVFLFAGFTAFTYLIQCIVTKVAATERSGGRATTVISGNGTKAGKDGRATEAFAPGKAGSAGEPRCASGTVRPVKPDASGLGRIIAVLVVLSTFYEVYVSVQYSKTAAVVSCIGYILLLYGAKTRIREQNGGRDGRQALNIVEATGIILLIYGMLLRDSSFMLASLLMLPVGLYEFLEVLRVRGNRCCGDRKPGAGETGGKGCSGNRMIENGTEGTESTHGCKCDRRAVRIFVFTFAPVFIWFLATRAVDTRAYRTNAAWKSFMEYNEVRMQFQDYRYDLLDYNKHGSRLKALGISENDALLYVTWQFGDDTVMGIDEMSEVLDNAPARWSVISCLKALAQHIYEDVLIFNPLVFGTLLFVLSALMAALNKCVLCGDGIDCRKDSHDKESFVCRADIGRICAMFTQLCIFAGIIVYYEYCGRWSHRIVFATMLVMAVSAVWMWVSCAAEDRSGMDAVADENKDAGVNSNININADTSTVADDEHAQYRRYIGAASFHNHAYNRYMQGMCVCAAAVMAAACVAVLLGNRLEYNRNKRELPDYNGFFETIAQDKDTLYIADTFTFQYAYRYDVFSPRTEGSMDNFAAVGSWFVNSPITKRITGSYGYSNPFRALAGVIDFGTEDDRESRINTEYLYEGSMEDSGEIPAENRTEDGIENKTENKEHTGGPVILADNMYVDAKREYLREHYGEACRRIDTEEKDAISGVSIYKLTR